MKKDFNVFYFIVAIIVFYKIIDFFFIPEVVNPQIDPKTGVLNDGSNMEIIKSNIEINQYYELKNKTNLFKQENRLYVIAKFSVLNKNPYEIQINKLDCDIFIGSKIETATLDNIAWVIPSGKTYSFYGRRNGYNLFRVPKGSNEEIKVSCQIGSVEKD